MRLPMTAPIVITAQLAETQHDLPMAKSAAASTLTGIMTMQILEISAL